MYTTSNLKYEDSDIDIKSEDKTIIHSNSIVAAEIRSDCEVCFDSERLKTKVVGKYNFSKLKSRLCENVEVRGPGITPRGISLEIILRHDDGRIKVLLAYQPSYLPQNNFISSSSSPIIQSLDPELALTLTDYLIVRERLNKRPLDLDINPDDMWKKPIHTDINDYELKVGTVKGTRHSFINGIEHVETIAPIEFDRLSLKATQIRTSSDNDNKDNFNHHTDNSDSDDDSDDYKSYFRRVLPGNIIIETQRWVPFEDSQIFTESKCRITWIITSQDGRDSSESNINNNSTIYSAEIAFKCPNMLSTPMDNSDTSMKPIPKLVSFFVDKLSN